MSDNKLTFLDGIRRFWPIAISLVILIANGAVLQYQMISADWQDVRERIIRLEERQDYILRHYDKANHVTQVEK